MAEFQNNAPAYDRTHRIHQLVLGVIIVNEGQEDAIVELLNKNEVYASFITRGKGTAPNFFAEVTGVGLLRKIILTAVMRDDAWSSVRKSLAERFALSRIAHGVAFATPLSGIMSISAYKMFGNIRIFEKPVNPAKDKKIKSKKIEGGSKK